jgi:hypothetical protein
MLNILTGLPADKKNDKLFVERFMSVGSTKVICGSSTMKMFCRIQNITPEIKIVFEKNIPVAKYKIENINLATEGIITLNSCYKYLTNTKTEIIDDAVKLAELFDKNKTINFFVGLSQNKDSNNYKNFGLLPRIEIVNKIVDFLKQKNKTINVFED